MSSRVTGRGLPGVQTSSMAWSARASMSFSVMPSSDRCAGMPTSLLRFSISVHAASADSY